MHERKAPLQLGARVRFAPYALSATAREEADRKTIRMAMVTGQVIYIHSQQRYFIAEYEVHGYKQREALYFKPKLK